MQEQDTLLLRELMDTCIARRARILAMKRTLAVACYTQDEKLLRAELARANDAILTLKATVREQAYQNYLAAESCPFLDPAAE